MPATKQKPAKKETPRLANIKVENARIGFRNFAGKEGRFNPQGRRNFCVFLDNDVAKDLKAMGWNIRWLKPRDEDEQEQAYLQVMVSYKAQPPKIVVITSTTKTQFIEDQVHILDYAEIQSVDLIIQPYNWEMEGRSGVKAYLKSMYITLIEDEFEKKYVNVPDSAKTIDLTAND